MALQRKLFLMEPKILEMDLSCFMHTKENHGLYRNARQRPYVNSSPPLQGGSKYLFAGGQSFSCSPDRTATVLGRNCRNPLRGDIQHRVLRYLALCG
jgi:hypothetical protein